MTHDALHLMNRLVSSVLHEGVGFVEYQESWNALESYITELERKAQLLDGWQRFERLEHERIMYDVDGNPSAVV